MLTFRATLRPHSATLSPWQADTLFGHLCWLILHHEGEAQLNAFLDEYRQGTPPLLLSDGFPGDWLPRPLVPPSPEAGPKRSKAEHIHKMQEDKEGKDIRWIGLDEFNAFRRGEKVKPERHMLSEHRTVLKNQINRLTGGTTAMDDEAEGGNLYDLDELRFVDGFGEKRVRFDISVYVKARDKAAADRASEWFTRLARSGYGAKKSAGYGHFSLQDWQPFPDFDDPQLEPNGFISLSNWVPARADPTHGFYNTLVKYGKLGEELANSDNPFKFPLIMLTAGSAFYADAPREWYGRLVSSVAPADERVVHYGYAFAVPAQLVKEV